MLTLRDDLVLVSTKPLPRNLGHHTLNTKPGGRQVRCVLLHKQADNAYRAVRYWSEKLNNRVQNMDTAHRECVFVVWIILFLSPYFDGMIRTVWTDHHARKWIINWAEATGELARCWPRLEDYCFYVVFWACVKLQATYELSGLPTKGMDNSDFNNDVPVLSVTNRL